MFRKGRMKADYRFVFFSSLEALFWSMIAPAAFMVVFMNDQGFTNSQIGLGLAASNAGSVIFLPIWGMVADKLGSKRKTLLILYMGVGFFALLAGTFTGNPYLTIFFIFCVIAFRGSVSSITDSWVITEVNTPDYMGNRINYGPIRSAGSIGYAAAAFIFYLVFTRLGVDTRYSWYASTLFAIPCIILVLSYKDRDLNTSLAPRQIKALSLRELKPVRLIKNYYFVTFFFVYMLINIPGYFSMSYISQLLQDFGTSPLFVGVLGSIRAVAEVPLLFLSQKIINKVGYKGTIIIISICLAIEEIAYVFCNQTYQVVIFQIMHGMVNGLMLGASGRYIFSLVPPELAATAQTFCGAVCSGITIVFNLFSGLLIDTFGIRVVFIIGASAMVLAILLFLSTLMIGKSMEIPPYDASKDETSKAILQKLYSAE